ncbi:uncharacterized protein BDZ99DRAFT_458913, partial [Mytilinidion resinicola]
MRCAVLAAPLRSVFGWITFTIPENILIGMAIPRPTSPPYARLVDWISGIPGPRIGSWSSLRFGCRLWAGDGTCTTYHSRRSGDM